MRRTAAVLLSTAALLAAAGCSSTDASTDAAGGTASPSSTTGSPSSSSTPSTSPSLSSALALQQWLNDGGRSQLDTISNDLEAVKAGLSSRDLKALGDACAKMTAHVESMQASKPMADERAANEWKLSLTYLQKAGTECTTGSESGDKASFDQMSADLSIGIHHVAAVTDPTA